ncbi:MAG: hypothetical protein ACYDCO_04010 [Armatimonadota bacterium]
MATIRDRCWLWGMRVNVLQESDAFGALGLGTSTMTVEDAIDRTGIVNVIMAGGLPVDEDTLASMPSAKRIICKTAIHGGGRIMGEKTLANLRAAKRLALSDTRIEGFHLDDFSTGSIDAGVAPGDITRLQFANAVEPPRVPLSATIYTMSLERPELAGLLPFFDLYLVPLWHADRIEEAPAAVTQLSGVSGKPMIFCLYSFDFGNSRPIPGDVMRRHLEVAEMLLLEERIAGLCICGTCMMDLELEANAVMYDWLARVGDHPIG